jgi:hypothetical protein
MPRSLVVLLFLLFPIGLVAQNSDQMAITLAEQTMAALVSAQSSVTSITLNANVTSPDGSETTSGTGTFNAQGLGQSRVDLDVGGATRSDARTMATGTWQVNGGTATAYAGHNCMTDAVWFFPALSSLAQTANANYVFKYIGLEEHASVNTQHIRVFQVFPQDSTGLLAQLSVMDFYLDPITSLPVAIASQVHPDANLYVNIPTEVRFSNYQTVNGLLIPFSFEQMLNGNVVLSATVTSVVVNPTLPQNQFTLQ